MRSIVRDNAVAAAWAVTGLVCLAWLGLHDFAFNGYDAEASASVHQMVTGHLLAFLQQAPVYGGSLLVRAPFGLAPDLWGGGALADYRMLGLPCLLATGALALWLVARLRAEGHSRLARGTALGLLVGSPAMLFALQIGHAEEILAGVLVVAAVLAAISDRWVWAAVLLGLGIGTKSWAVVAVAPVVFALPSRRWPALLLAGAIAFAVLAPFQLAQHLNGAHGGYGVTVTGTGIIFQPEQLWWFLGNAHAVVHNTHGHVLVGYRAAPAWLGPYTHPLIVLVSPVLTVVWWRRRRGRPWEPLALLTLLLMLRCLLDPWNNYYYAVPFLIALTVWESLHRRDAPVLALGATVATWAVFERLAHAAPDQRAAVYLALMIPSVMALSLWLLAPGVWWRLASFGRRRSTARRGVGVPASDASR